SRSYGFRPSFERYGSPSRQASGSGLNRPPLSASGVSWYSASPEETASEGPCCIVLSSKPITISLPKTTGRFSYFSWFQVYGRIPLLLDDTATLRATVHCAVADTLKKVYQKVETACSHCSCPTNEPWDYAI